MSVPALTTVAPEYVLLAKMTSVPVPVLVNPPPPWRPPENVVPALLPPTLRTTAAEVVLLSDKLPEPLQAAKYRGGQRAEAEPPPLVSNVLPESAPVLDRSSVPLETNVVPK